MKIDRITFTGADDRTFSDEMAAISQVYPQAEWGILFSIKKQGAPRYPTAKWINELASRNIPLSAHFCGWYSRQVLEEMDFSLIDQLPAAFRRVQLNYNFSKSKDWHMPPLLDYIANNPGRSFIFQANKANAKVVGMLECLCMSNIHILHDSYGGRGIEPSEPPRLFSKYTGYSGGIHPGNFRNIAKRIMSAEQVTPFYDSVWVDMESGVRTDDAFDLRKVMEILHAYSNLQDVNALYFIYNRN
jgi:hypothetical protein